MLAHSNVLQQSSWLGCYLILVYIAGQKNSEDCIIKICIDHYEC